MKKENVIIVGGGPCGMSCAVELQKYGINPLIIEKEGLVNTLYNFPTHQTFFSTSTKLEIGEVAFITEKQKPVRNQALAYYRAVAERKKLRINTYEKVNEVKQIGNGFQIKTKKNTDEYTYHAENIIIASGYYDQPNSINIPGESLKKVMHYFKEAHPYYDKDVVVIGGRNSAVDTSLELYKAGARITVLYRGSAYSKSIKPWILPDFDSLINKGIIEMEFNAHVTKITDDKVYYNVNGKSIVLKNDFVFAMTGYQPDIRFLKKIGINVDEKTGRPDYKAETFETNIARLYVAGVIISGYNDNETFIENGRLHGKKIAEAIINK